MKVEKAKTYTNISLEFIKKHLRLDTEYTDDDFFIQTLIETATNVCENYIDGDIADTVATIYERNWSGNIYCIYEPNIRSIEAISGGTAISTDAYVIDKYEDYWLITFNTSMTNDLTIVYNSGFENGDIARPLSHAVAIYVSEMYDTDRSGYVAGNIKPTSLVLRLLNNYKRLV